jgi:hypothetical protein
VESETTSEGSEARTWGKIVSKSRGESVRAGETIVGSPIPKKGRGVHGVLSRLWKFGKKKVTGEQGVSGPGRRQVLRVAEGEAGHDDDAYDDDTTEVCLRWPPSIRARIVFGVRDGFAQAQEPIIAEHHEP